jgi:hypothetical protein
MHGRSGLSAALLVVVASRHGSGRYVAMDLILLTSWVACLSKQSDLAIKKSVSLNAA